MPFIYPRTVRFQDTDAAGVVYFANVLTLCHEAYEALLSASGVNLNTFFKGTEVAVPIVHATVDFLKPMVCGDRLEIHLSLATLQVTEFELRYHLFAAGHLEKPLSVALTRHVCIDSQLRSRRSLPDFLLMGLQQIKSDLEATPSPVDG